MNDGTMYVVRQWHLWHRLLHRWILLRWYWTYHVGWFRFILGSWVWVLRCVIAFVTTVAFFIFLGSFMVWSASHISVWTPRYTWEFNTIIWQLLQVRCAINVFGFNLRSCCWVANNSRVACCLRWLLLSTFFLRLHCFEFVIATDAVICIHTRCLSRNRDRGCRWWFFLIYRRTRLLLSSELLANLLIFGNVRSELSWSLRLRIVLF